MSDQTVYTAGTPRVASPGYRDILIRESDSNLNESRLGTRRQGTRKNKSIQPEDRARLRSHWVQAKIAVTAMALSVATDGAEVFGHALRVRDALDELWKLRRYREEIWVSILDLSQSLLMQIANDLDNVKPEGCRSLKELISLYLSPAPKTKQDLVEATRLVIDAGFDPYEGLSPLGRLTLDAD